LANGLMILRVTNGICATGFIKARILTLFLNACLVKRTFQVTLAAHYKGRKVYPVRETTFMRTMLSLHSWQMMYGSPTKPV
jgi:hypothetical protein